jgi:hypothetical protein
MSINLDRIKHDLLEKQARVDSRLLPTPATRREPSSSERDAPYRGPGHGLLFCTHSKSYFETCGQCRRDKRIARLNYERFCKRHGLSE